MVVDSYVTAALDYVEALLNWGIHSLRTTKAVSKEMRNAK